MLKLTVKPGEYLLIGNDIKLVFTGGSSNNMHILVDAPKIYNIVRSTVLEKGEVPQKSDGRDDYYKEDKLSRESMKKIRSIIMAEKKQKRNKKSTENNEKLT